MTIDDEIRKRQTTEFIQSTTRFHAFYEDPVIDNLLSTVLTLGSELWVNRRRQLVVEKILEEKGIISLDEIEAFDPDKNTMNAWAAHRDEFIERLYQGLHCYKKT
jgi:hypothetical protein